MKGYECISMDLPGCNGVSTTYSEPNFTEWEDTQVSMEFIEEQCLISNPNDECKQKVCIAEIWFLRQFIANTIDSSNWIINDDFRHPNFDPNANCAPQEGRGSAEISCCGTYPTRFPYKTNGGLRGCCQGRTYQTDTFTCCPDGSIALACP